MSAAIGRTPLSETLLLMGCGTGGTELFNPPDEEGVTGLWTSTEVEEEEFDVEVPCCG
jgi:hypothetical protein